VELRVGGDFFSSLLTLCYYGTFACVATLCDLELVHQSDVFYSRVLQFYCAEQFSLRRSQWNGCAKAARMVLVLQCSSVYRLAILIVVCKSQLADRIGTARQGCEWCFGSNFCFILALMMFTFKNHFKNASISSFFRLGIEIRFLELQYV